MSAWDDKEGLLALLIGIMLIVAIVVAVLAFVPLKSFELDESESVNAAGNVETLALSVDAEICDLTINFQELIGKEVQVDLAINGHHGFLSPVPEITFSVDHNQVGTALSVDVVLHMDTGPSSNYDDVVCLVTIDPALRTAMEVSVDVGKVIMDAAFPVALDGVNLYANVGSVAVELGEGVALHGDLDLRSKVGSVDLSCTSLTLSEEVDVDLTTSTGSVILDVRQLVDPGADVAFNCRTDVGSIEVDLLIAGDTAGEITSSANIGDIKTDLTGFSGPVVHLVSDNFPADTNIHLVLESDVGSIDIKAEWSG